MPKICKKRVHRNDKKKIYLETFKKCPGSLYFTLLTIGCRFTLNSARDMIKTYSQNGMNISVELAIPGKSTSRVNKFMLFSRTSDVDLEHDFVFKINSVN